MQFRYKKSGSKLSNNQEMFIIQLIRTFEPILLVFQFDWKFVLVISPTSLFKDGTFKSHFVCSYESIADNFFGVSKQKNTYLKNCVEPGVICCKITS